MNCADDNFATRLLASGESIFERINSIGQIVPSAKFGFEKIAAGDTAVLFFKSPAGGEQERNERGFSYLNSKTYSRMP